jgi:hypothetical protein
MGTSPKSCSWIPSIPPKSPEEIMKQSSRAEEACTPKNNYQFSKGQFKVAKDTMTELLEAYINILEAITDREDAIIIMADVKEQLTQNHEEKTKFRHNWSGSSQPVGVVSQKMVKTGRCSASTWKTRQKTLCPKPRHAGTL